MTIGIDCRIYSSRHTGIGRYVHELIKRVCKNDAKNNYVLFFNEPEFSAFNIKLPNVKSVLADAPIYSVREQIHFLKILNNEKLDLMHFTHFNAPLFYRKPSVVTIHDLTLFYYPGKKKKGIISRIGYNLAFKNIVKKAKKIIAISYNTKNDLVKLLKADVKKIDVIYQAVGDEFTKSHDEKSIDKTLQKLGIKKPFLLYTGVWRLHKNLPNLIKAFNELKKEYGLKDLSLVITGKEDPFYPEPKFLPKELGIDKDVILTGMIEEKDLVNLYNAALIYVFPSLYEGFGLPPLEAMACGVPVAASLISSIPEICGKGNAVYFDPNDYKDMALKIYALYKDTKLQEKIIENGLNWVKNYSWDKTADETLKIYRDCLMN
ncbi:glycosyltransferase family 4 protein [Candidatus Peregrinibacteria bacterium]|nr:glycosyltransferase family 4 protein [Candidatus Peregrinibacteria bacterium]